MFTRHTAVVPGSSANQTMFSSHWTSIILPVLYSISLISAAPTDGESPTVGISNWVVIVFTVIIVPSAASFYVPHLPDLHQDKDNPLHIFSGHIESDPNGSSVPTDLSAHLFFVLVKARRTADKERVMFWFNVAMVLILYAFTRTDSL